MGQLFQCPDIQAFFEGRRVPRFANIRTSIERKLSLLDAAATLEALRVPPTNRLETLRGNRRGQFSIRINDPWRICFNWTTEGPANVEIVDYH
ncbi:HigB toxin protein [Candidatus Burkholderia brachyanthoides]|nr:HigB toxin protein [Candidatus Burkholderia brachyanthoides]